MSPFKYFVHLNDLREGDRRLFYLNEIKDILEGDAEQIQRYQLDRLRKVIDFSYNHSAFYRNRFDAAQIHPEEINSIADLIRIPVLEKNDIRNNQAMMFSKEIPDNEVFKTATGGTTSSPVPFCVDRASVARRRAATLFFFRWFNYELGDKMAYLWGAEQDVAPIVTLKQKIRNVLIDRSLCLQTSYLDNNIMKCHYDKLVKFKPKVLQAYPTPLFIFANYLEKNNLDVNIDTINVAAEYLYDYQRDKIEKIFKTKIFNWYGARELGHIATECSEHSGMHINISGLLIEIIKDGKQVIDEEGDIVVTDLLNRAMPLIRYKIGDIGKVSTRTCKCGSALPILESISGRLVDTFKKKDGSFIPGVAFTNRIIKECQGIQELQIIQKDYQLFHLNIIKGEQYNSEDLDEVKRKIALFMHDNLEYEVSFVNKIATESSGKVRFCKSEISESKDA